MGASEATMRAEPLGRSRRLVRRVRERGVDLDGAPHDVARPAGGDERGVEARHRVRERGRRKERRLPAVGARSRDILTQFLVEAVTLSLIGGVIGISLGVGGSNAINALAEWRTVLAPEAILLAFGFSAAIGIFFGFYPARKASRLDPIEALRYE